MGLNMDTKSSKIEISTLDVPFWNNANACAE